MIFVIPLIEVDFVNATAKTVISGYLIELPSTFIGYEKGSFSYMSLVGYLLIAGAVVTLINFLFGIFKELSF